MTLLDLDELPELFDRHPLYSARRPAPARFRRSDYLGDPSVPLAESARRLVEQRTGRRPDGPVRLLTNLRYLGLVFNPVSFFYLYDRSDGEGRRGDRRGHEHAVAPAPRLRGRTGKDAGPIRGRVGKELHVSPFMAMDAGLRLANRPARGCYCASTSPTSNVAGRIFEATLDLRRRELSPASMTRVLLTYPPTSLAVPLRIYWNAAAPEAQGSAVPPPAASPPAPGAMIDRAARAAVHALLRRIRAGRLCVVEGWSGERLHFGPAAAPRAGHVSRCTRPTSTVASWEAALGSARRTADGLWDADDLTVLARIATREIGRADHLRDRLAPVRGPLQRLRGLPALNTRRRRSAQRRRPLRPGQRDVRAVPRPRVDDVFERVLRDARRDPRAGPAAPSWRGSANGSSCGRTTHVLEIGTGWGGLALYMASRFGCRVTTTTLSREQREYAEGRIRAAGLEDRVRVLGADYRELTGRTTGSSRSR